MTRLSLGHTGPAHSIGPSALGPANRRGVTLLEILVGLTILGLCFAPLFELLQGSRQVLGTSQEMLMLQNLHHHQHNKH